MPHLKANGKTFYRKKKKIYETVPITQQKSVSGEDGIVKEGAAVMKSLCLGILSALAS